MIPVRQRWMKSDHRATRVAQSSLSEESGRQSSSDNEHHTHADVLQKLSVKHLAQRRATRW
jgi:hypothetical protein